LDRELNLALLKVLKKEKNLSKKPRVHKTMETTGVMKKERPKSSRRSWPKERRRLPTSRKNLSKK